ncbi:C-X-C chemokine receptor type 6-like [Latimeria chalumnae]|uniref:C-X-C chemokine receptor type 6 n=1 Tax=Latimeria chalumnae TaxID=7897 RepID=H3AJR2_LATCH
MRYSDNYNDTDDFNLEDYYADSCNEDNFNTFSIYFLPWAYSIIFITGLLGNCLVIFTYIYHMKLRTLTDIYLVNLSVADVLFVSTLPFWAYSAAHEWVFGRLMCKLTNGLYTINLYSCMLTLVCICVDRYIAIAQATKSHTFHNKKLLFGKLTCFGVWVFAIILSIPELMFSKVLNLSSKYCRMSFPPDTKIEIEKITIFSQLTVGFLFPFLAMVICYSVIIKTLLNAKGVQRHKSLRIIFVVVAIFIILQLPYNIMKLKKMAGHHDAENCDTQVNFKYADLIAEAIAYSHCCFNPFLYAFIGEKFRKHFYKLVKDLGCVRQQTLSVRHRNEESSKSLSLGTNTERISMY